MTYLSFHYSRENIYNNKLCVKVFIGYIKEINNKRIEIGQKSSNKFRIRTFPISELTLLFIIEVSYSLCLLQPCEANNDRAYN